MKPNPHSGAIRIGMPTRISSVQGRNRGLGQPPLHERSKLRAERSIIGWGPFFGSGPRFGGEEKKGSKASRTGQGRGRGLRHRGFRPMTGCGCCWGGAAGCWFWSLEIGDLKVLQAGRTMVNGETEVNLILAGSALAGIINQLFFRIQRNIT
jgi:hypothetical protein